MVFLDTSEIAARSSLADARRSDIAGGVLNAILPIAVLVIANGLLAPGSWQASPQFFAAQHLTPATWLAGIAWMTIYPMLGVARWTAWQAGERGRKASWWVAALLAASLAFPFAAPLMDMFWLTFAQIALMLLAVITAGKLFETSRPALFWMLPALLWLGAIGILAFTAIASGWSPGFPATQNGAQGS